MACRKSSVRSRYVSTKIGGVAQLEERLHGMQEVMGSNPITFHYSCVAQLEEHLATNEKVVGSTPAVTTKKFSGL